jgi:hypothetical protein
VHYWIGYGNSMRLKRSDCKRLGMKLLPSWHNAELFSIARWRREHPKRYYLQVRRALESLRLRYWEHVTVWNPLHTGKHFDAGFQTIDFVVQTKGLGHIAILFLNKKNLNHVRDREAWQHRVDLLTQRHIPILIVPVHHTSQEYQMKIHIFIYKQKFIRPSLAVPSTEQVDAEHQN